jgi:hypothetical protein
MHRTLTVVAIVALIVISTVDLLVVRKVPRSDRSPAWFLLYILLTSILVSAAADLLSRSH